MPERSDATLVLTSSLDDATESMVADVRRGLAQMQKELDPKYFYDERGSELFEQITRLPEYYPTRSERALLEATMPALIETLRPSALVELGAGSANKTRVILDSMLASDCGLQYVPVDVSADFLTDTASRLSRDYPEIRIDPAVGDFTSELALPSLERPALFAFLGSTIGNFSEPSALAILGRAITHMRRGDSFLLGVDLRKNPDVIEAAYNDSAGVTADFNLNVLRVLNRELGANFDLASFTHRAFYNRTRHRIEMHLDSRTDQIVCIPGIGEIGIGKGESIRTELSYKYDRQTVASLFEKSGLCLGSWLTGSDEAFALAVGTRNWAAT